MRHSLYARIGKRILDIVFSALGLLLFAPLMALIAFLVKLDSPGAVFYRGLRAGLKGRPFVQLKFRTMVRDAEQRGGLKTTSNDDRITRVGRFLRATKLDELPQLINVLRGEMSLVGPRPMVEQEVGAYAEWERRALDVRPGITDWASIRFHNEEEILGRAPDWKGYYERHVRPEKSWLRVAYAEACSLRSDLAILFQTATVLISSRLAWSETADHHFVFVPWGLRVADLPDSLLGARAFAGVALEAEPTGPAPLVQVSGGVPAAIEEAQLRFFLGRDPIDPDLEAVRSLIAGETVLVTGAGGSIGGELCRRIARLAPKRLVALGHGEHSITQLVREFEQTFPGTEIQPAVADVRDRGRLRQVFEEYRPDSVFHAAGHKQLPLLEDNVREAVTSIVLGTWNAVGLADEYEVRHFLHVSSIKAARPTSVLGVSKRVAELLIQPCAGRDGRSFASVRLCNVLGSRSSVMPTFLNQIRAGGPVTVTHPDMRRHFILLSDAVALTLDAAAVADGASVLLIDAGQPVRVIDLATALIRAYARDAASPVEIVVTGVRPGERLDEADLVDPDRTTATRHPRIRRVQVEPPAADRIALVEELIECAERGEPDAYLRAMLTRIVPEYNPLPRSAPIDSDMDSAALLS